jgi:hypothetical protein
MCEFFEFITDYGLLVFDLSAYMKSISAGTPYRKTVLQVS